MIIKEQMLTSVVVKPDMRKAYVRKSCRMCEMNGRNCYDTEFTYLYDNKVVYGDSRGYNIITRWISNHLINASEVHLLHGGILEPNGKMKTATVRLFRGTMALYVTLYVKDDKIARVKLNWPLVGMNDSVLSFKDLYALKHDFIGTPYSVDAIIPTNQVGKYNQS